MKSRRMTVTVYGDVGDVDVMDALRKHVSIGRISRNDTCYCLSSVNRLSGIAVEAEITWNGSDTFRVYRDHDKPKIMQPTTEELVSSGSQSERPDGL